MDDAWLGRPAAYAEGGDSSLQEIYQKEVQSHLEVIRAYLRNAWLAVGTHTVTEDLYRACHTLRGASRTAGIRHSIRLAEPLHNWLRRMFDHDATFDETGLAVLADCVVGFEDVLVGRARGHRPLHEPRPAGEAHRAAGRGARKAPGRGAAADGGVPGRCARAARAAAAVEPPRTGRAAARFRSIRCCPGAATVVPERDIHGVLPKAPAPTGIEGRPPYLHRPSRDDAGSRRRAAAASADRADDYDPDVAAIFSEEATELLESADAALSALKSERGSRERVTELQRVLHTLKGGARMAGITAMGDLSHELESLVIQLDDDAVRLDDRSLEVVQSSLDELARMRDYVSAGRPVAAARDLVTRIRLVGGAGRPAAKRPQPCRRPGPRRRAATATPRVRSHRATASRRLPCAAAGCSRRRGRAAASSQPKSRPRRKPSERRRARRRRARRCATPPPIAPRSRASTRTCSTTC